MYVKINCMNETAELYSIIKDRYDDYRRELTSIEDRLSAYSDAIASIAVKSINGNKYYYKQWREGTKVHSKMLGKVAPGAAATEEDAIIERRKLLSRRDELIKLINILEPKKEELHKLATAPDLDDEFTFEVFWKNELSSRVSVHKSKVHVSRYIIHPIRQIFHADTITRHQLMEALRLRCFEEGRADIDVKLAAIGLTEYDPLEIVRRTHGVSYNDFIWIRFPGEKLRAEDVLVRELV